MKKQIGILFLCWFIGFPLILNAQQGYRIFRSNGEKVSTEQLFKASQGKSHIFFGELHNNAVSHWLQLELAKYLYQQHSTRLIIGAEMFEADNQLLIDEYLSDLISQKSFEDEVRLWKNYKTDYKPILEFAKKNNLRFIATNIPRRYANAIFHGGMGVLDDLSPVARSFLPALPIRIDTTQASYRELSKMAEAHKGSYMLEAQAIKDASMAHFIAANSSDSSVFLHLNGSYHSDRHEGIVNFLKREIPAKNMLVITTVSQEQVESLEKKNETLADFIICVDQDFTLTH